MLQSLAVPAKCPRTSEVEKGLSPRWQALAKVAHTRIELTENTTKLSNSTDTHYSDGLNGTPSDSRFAQSEAMTLTKFQLPRLLALFFRLSSAEPAR